MQSFSESLNSELPSSIVRQERGYMLVKIEPDWFVELDKVTNDVTGSVTLWVEFRRGHRYSLTGTSTGGQALALYSTIVKWMYRGIEYVDANRVVFSAADSRTIPLYTKLANKIAAKYGTRPVIDGSKFIIPVKK